MTIQARVTGVIDRLRHWPAVSGFKPLRGDLKGNYRIRTGDWRVLFSVDAAEQLVTIWKIANRRDVYED